MDPESRVETLYPNTLNPKHFIRVNRLSHESGLSKSARYPSGLRLHNGILILFPEIFDFAS